MCSVIMANSASELRILLKRALAYVIHKFLFIILARFKSFNVDVKLSRFLRCTSRLNGINKAYFDRINLTRNMF